MTTFTALPTDVAQAYRNGAPDAHGNPPERTISPGPGHPCRHCLKNVPAGAEMLVLAHKPFAGSHPYAEVGPIFLCADACTRFDGTGTPEVLTTSPDYLIKGYSSDDRIVYGTGTIAPTKDLADRIDAIFNNPEIVSVHVRSARNNCYLARVNRDD
ncbi:MAG: DUF1203 domain-containing protein [Pseudomonadota bacterium]